MRWTIVLLSCCVALSRAMPAAEAEGQFRLRPGDLLDVSVYGHADLSRQVRIHADGSLSLPLIGRVGSITGLSLMQVESTIGKRLRDGYLKEASVTAQVVELAPRPVSILGAVRQPGSIELSPYLAMTAMEAVAKAGGFQPDADRHQAVVMRTVDGQQRALPLPAVDTPMALSADVVLQPGDLIVVPRLGRVHIIGAVKNPGPQTLPGKGALTVSRAIVMAGGFDTFAQTQRVQLIPSAGGEPITVDVRAVLAGERRVEDPVVGSGDIVSVLESRL